MTAGRLWFVEVLVWILIALTFVCWLPAADRLERRRPFAFAAGFLVARAGTALRPVGPGLRPRGMVHDPGLLVLRGGLGRGQVVDGVAAARGDAGVDRQPARLLRQHASRSVGARRVPAADLAARDPMPGLVHRRRGDGRGSLAVHLSDALPGVSVVRRSSRCVGVVAAIIVGVLLTRLVNATRTWLRERTERAATAASVPALR